jgi:ABC-type transporter Mla MlaB component
MATSPSAKIPSSAAATAAAAKAALSQSGTFAVEQLSPDSAAFPPIYEAAILYSADHHAGAEAVLKEYMRTPDGKNSIRAWLMMFDLYQLTHNRREFDALAMLFTVKFERSPPIWVEQSENNDPRRKEKREHKDFFLVTPQADGSLLPEVDRLEAFAKQLGTVRVDYAKVKTISPEESELLAMVFQRLRKAKIHIWFNSVEAFIETLKRGINERTGQPLHESQGFWSLLFELFILDGKLSEYEELGLEYAVAFEMSPPAWETVKRPQGASDAPDANTADAAVVGFPLKGVVSGASKEMLQQLSIYASSRAEVAIDMGGLLRIDFMATSIFFEAIRSIHMQQKRVILSNINELVAALLEVFGMSKHAILMRKKPS